MDGWSIFNALKIAEKKSRLNMKKYVIIIKNTFNSIQRTICVNMLSIEPNFIKTVTACMITQLALEIYIQKSS